MLGRTSAWMVGVVLGVAACAAPGEEDSGALDPDGFAEALAEDGYVDLIVELADDGAEGVILGPDELVDNLLLDHDGAAPLKRWNRFSMAFVRVGDPRTLRALRKDSRVVGLWREQRYDHALTQSLGLISQPAAQTAGFTGAGTAVAVLDTGVDFTRSAFGSCSAAGSSCSVVYAADIAPSDSSRDTGSYHGTNVAGIVLGVAPETDIIALDVFRADGYAYTSDLITAMSWIVANQASYNIVAANLSLGGGRYTSACDTDALTTPVAAAKAAGVLSAIATGNNGYSDSIASPSCITEAVSVGAVYDTNMGGVSWSTCSDSSTAADKVTCFSNSSAQVDLLAPGALITAAGITMGGTSQATPHVAGAIAVAAHAFPSETPAERLARLSATGDTVTDARNGISSPRIDVSAMVAASTIDTTAPTGTVSINSGASATNSTAVTLTLTGSDDTAVTEMCVSNSSTCTNWVPFATTSAWTLTSTAGTRTVTVSLRDAAGNTSGAITDSIVYDITKPTNGTATAAGGASGVTVSWTGFSDTSGVSSYTVVASTGTSAPTSCTTGTAWYSGADTSALITGLTAGTTYRFRVCATDAAGNLSTGATGSIQARTEYDAPTGGAVTINADAVYATSTAVTINPSATDASAVSKICLSNTSTCTTWKTYASSVTWTLSGGGARTVYAWFQDSHGNTTSTPVTDTITVDTTKPTNGTVAATGASGGGALSWSGFSDAGSGLASYKVVGKAGTTAPTACTTGTTHYAGTDTSTTITGLTNGTAYSVRVCAYDSAGLLSTGATATFTPAPEYNAPTGTVTINNGDTYAASKTVTLGFSATDDTAVSAVCVSNSTTCSTWKTMGSTMSWTLAGGGARTVYVWYRDSYGTAMSSPVTDSIFVDVTKPTNGTASATATTGAIGLSWTGFSDAGSGLSGYKVVYAAGATAPTSCSAGTLLTTTTGTSASLTGLAAGATHAFRVCAVDNAGLVSTGATASATAL